MPEEFQFEDADGDTVTVTSHPLEHVEKTLAERFRPGKFRQILKVEQVAPWWKQSIVHDNVTSNAEWIESEDGASDFATGTASVSREGYDIFEMVSGFKYTAREMIRSQKEGVPLDTARAEAVVRKGEEVLNWLAMNGTRDGENQFNDFKGIYNTDGATVLLPADNALLATSGDSLEVLFAAATTPDLQHAFAKILYDLISKMEVAFEDQSVETASANSLVVPLSLKHILRSPAPGGMNTYEQQIRSRSDISKIVYNKLANEDGKPGIVSSVGTNLRQLIMGNTTDSDFAQFVLPKAPGAGKTVKTARGVSVPYNMVTGGFRTKAPACIIKANLQNAA